MSRPEDHLLRAADIAAGKRQLGELTGLSRIAMEMQTLEVDDTLTLDAGAEQFLYVLDGHGNLRAGGEAQTIETGDFLALEPTESATVRAESTLTVLTGRLSSD